MAHVAGGVELYEDHFGLPPRGMWPAEGSVAQEIVTMVSQSGIEWMASDEGVLANSLGFDSFTRNAAEVVVEADQLYRPYYVQGTRGGPVAMIFRDVALSDKVGFTYSKPPGEQAAEDFVNRIHAIRDALQADGAEGPHLVSVILDGENAWEFYENDGKAFLHSLYQMLSDDPLIKTVTPTEFLEIAPEQPAIDDLHAGSWINHDFSTWIGEEEENLAWDYLFTVRDFLQGYLTGSRSGSVTEEALAEAMASMYAAEGSDWFWWYGADQNSGDDGIFDRQFRETLKQVYFSLGEEAPEFLDVPIIPEQAAAADRPATGFISPQIDGIVTEGEWDAGGQYQASGGAMAAANPFFESLTYGLDSRNLYINLQKDPSFEAPVGETKIEIYLRGPGTTDALNFSSSGSLLGFAANGLLEMTFTGGDLVGASFYQVGEGSWSAVAEAEGTGPFALTFADETQGLIAGGISEDGGQDNSGPNVFEIAIPYSAVGTVDEGSLISFRALYQEPLGDSFAEADRLPGPGPAEIVIPDLGTTTLVLEIIDPENDDHGPGTYTYPSDSVFNSGNFDIQTFQVGYTEESIVFKFNIRGPLDNVWDSPNGISLQTFDIYIDQDADGQGGEALLPGRNLVFEDGTRWDYAITIEGWTSGIYIPGEEGPQAIAESSEFQVLADPGLRKVTIRVPKSLLGDDPENWQYAAVVTSQEGFPSAGVMRVRDVVPEAEQWRVGGAPEGATNHTRVIDLVWPEPGIQEEKLADFDDHRHKTNGIDGR